MATKKKMLQAAAGQAGGAGLDITEVFSTYLYDGTGSAQTITNDIDLAGEGGLVWIKARNANSYHSLWDTERGTNRAVFSHLTNAESNFGSNTLTSFNSNGFSSGSAGLINDSAENYASWTFRKAPKFFDVVTWTGDGVNGRQISHNLGCEVGSILIKATSTGLSSNFWAVYHKDTPTTFGVLNGTNAFSSPNEGYTMANIFGDNTVVTLPTSTKFTVAGNQPVNNSGTEYVAYLFAHNDGDGGFGPDGDQDIIKCGSYTGNGSTTGPVIDLGFEPQWVMIKRASGGTGNWFLVDAIRGLPVGSNSSALFPNNSNAEDTNAAAIDIIPTGFQPKASSIYINASGSTYIYMAIRRGPLAQPESGTEVFAQDFVFSSEANAAGVQYYSGFPVDMSLFSGSRSVGGNHDVRSRLTGDKRMFSNATDAETSAGTPWWDTNEGWKPSTGGTLNTDALTWMWKRAPGFFDVVAFTLGSASNREVKHNLAAVPEMIWWKERSDTSYWMFWHKDFTSSQYMSLHLSDAIATSANIWGTSAPTSTGWYMKETAFGGSGNTCISYTFASLPGVSKVGSYTGTGSAFNVDCGFTAGARFVLIKKTSGTGDWGVFDTVRGITDSSSPLLRLNNTNAEANFDYLDPYSGGFAHSGANLTFNAVGAEYIFYAIA